MITELEAPIFLVLQLWQRGWLWCSLYSATAAAARQPRQPAVGSGHQHSHTTETACCSTEQTASLPNSGLAAPESFQRKLQLPIVVSELRVDWQQGISFS